MINEYMSLSTRLGFNKSLSHFRLVTGILQQLADGANLANVIDEMEKQKSLEKAQIGPILNAVLRERMQYRAISFNLPNDFQDFEKVCDTIKEWNLIDTVIAYHHPQLGITLLNPKELGQWKALQDISGEELVVIYAKSARESDGALESRALEAIHDLLVGRTPKHMELFNDPSLRPRPAPPAPAAAAPAARTPAGTAQAAESAAAPAESDEGPGESSAAAAVPEPSGKARMTPKYSVQVTNELFHNGNVEAWKNIVESYKTKFPDLEVHIFHDGKKVNNINSLFKWGKVNNGDVLLFSVSGEEIKGVAKLQRYLFEGASARYSNFLKKDVNKVLNLF